MKLQNHKETNYNENKATFKMQNFYILLAFLLSIIALLLLDFSICCYLIKYQPIQKQLLPFHFLNNTLKI